MRHAAGEHGQALLLGRPAQGLLGRLRSVMSIETPSTAGRPVPEKVNGIFVVCSQRTRALRVGDRLLAHHLRLSAAHHLEVVLAEVPGLLVGARELGVGAADQLLDGGAVGLRDRAVGHQEPALGVLREDEVRHQVDHLAQPRLRLAQRAVRLPLLRQVDGDADRAAGRSGRVAQRLDVHDAEPSVRLVLVGDGAAPSSASSWWTSEAWPAWPRNSLTGMPTTWSGTGRGRRAPGRPRS